MLGRSLVEHPIAMVVALGEERRALQGALTSLRRERTGAVRLAVGDLAGHAVVVIQAGIGRERARRALLSVSRRFALRAAWSLGFAGGLTEHLNTGDLVCPSIVLLDDGLTGKPFPVASAQADVRAALTAAGIPCHEGAVLTVDAPLRTPQAKQEAHRRTTAVAVDMEAVGIAEAAATLGIPWLAFKAVVDPVGEPLPEFLAGCTTPEGDLRWRGLLGSLLLSGERRRTLGRLDRASRQAGHGLRRCLDLALRAGVALTPPVRSSTM